MSEIVAGFIYNTIVTLIAAGVVCFLWVSCAGGWAFGGIALPLAGASRTYHCDCEEK